MIGHVRLRLRFRLIQARLDDHEAERLPVPFAAFAVHEAELTYSIGGGKGSPARELIISKRGE